MKTYDGLMELHESELSELNGGVRKGFDIVYNDWRFAWICMYRSCIE